MENTKLLTSLVQNAEDLDRRSTDIQQMAQEKEKTDTTSDKHQKSKIKTGLDGKHTVVQKIAEPHPEKEYMDIFNECEEIRPTRDPDFTGVVGRIRCWRPPYFFGERQDSDGEEAVEDPLDDLPPPEPQEEFEPVELLDLDTVDIPIPNIDEDLPIPYFDNSLDIERNLGNLQI